MLAIGKTLTAEQKLKRVSTEIVGHDEFMALAGVFMIGTKQVVDGLPTSCTNGRDEMYGREFIENLNEAELRFLMLHECYHKMFKHLTTWKHLWDKDKQKANQVCDLVINLKLFDTEAYKRGWLKMPEGGLLDVQYRGMNAKQIWDKLPKDDEGQGGGGNGSNGEGFDTHDWDGAEELSAEDKELLAREIDEAVRQGALLAGKTGRDTPRDFNELLETKQDWRELLREFVTTTSKGDDYATWSRVNRRYVGADMLMPASVSEAMGEVVMGVDLSGSIDNVAHARAMGDVTGILRQVNPSKVHVMYWDTEVRRHEIYLPEDFDSLVQTTKPAGGGGTDASAVSRYMNEHGIEAECVIQFTDGWVGNTWGEWSVPILWCINGNRSAVAPMGRTIHIED